MRRLATQLVPPQRGNRSDQGYLKLSVSPKVSTGDRWFESISLQRRVCCELDFGHYGAPRTRCSGLSSSARALLLLFPVERAVRAPFSSSLVRLCFNRRLLDIRISCSNSCNFAYIASPRRDLIQVNQSDRIYSTAR